MEVVDVQKEVLAEVEILGHEALFTELRVDRNSIPEGMYCYDLRHGEDNGIPAALEESVLVNYFGTVLMTDKLEIEKGHLSLAYEDFAYTGEKMTAEEFLSKRKESEPSLIQTAEKLVEFLDDYDMLLHMTEKEADVLLGYMEGHGYVLGEKGGILYRGDLCYEQDSIHWKEYSADDAIDAACEWNYVIFSVSFINYCLSKVIIEEGVGLMSEVLEEIKVLLWNRYGKQMYLVKTTKHKLPEILEIIAYIQRINNEICSSFELPVIDICKILVDCFGFEMQKINFYEQNQEQIKQVLGSVKRLKYHSTNKRSDEAVLLIELADFWEVYDGQKIPRETIDHSEISEIIIAMVRDNPNARPWLL